MGRILENLSLCLPPDEYKQYLIILIKGLPITYNCNAEIIELCDIGDSVWGKLITDIKRARKLKEIKEKIGFDICVSFGVNANILNVKSKCKEKIVLTEHNIKTIEHSLWGRIGVLYNFLMKKYYNSAEKIITVSEYMK